ncbi:probable LRR receptor-like serine/threonine-protein kinase at5g45780 [Phtheirospermum japonicum]|uniref:Probable LRR receptor-like serine/threonine-protein kinase at5g45780 n=1 Tax=Phtheirospermum japonicum TaxID=374723 RepID=A0A830CF88_9LAMI|nr:probable LRR receptor-like serine/threonine-protein kinase at5g45780 [Phtheirospermum japonicum]
MAVLPFFSLFFFFLPFTLSSQHSKPNTNATLSLLMTIKSSLDPQNLILTSWDSVNTTDPCNDGSFEGISCNEHGQLVNISLQGKGLYGQIPPEIGQLKSLSGLYLHFNKLHGVVPREIANLTELTDLYLNVNDLSGQIPPEIGQMSNLQVLQLCYNRLTGNIPTQLRLMKQLSVVALQSNQLTGAIPARLGELKMLTRLDLSFNHLFGSIPSKLADLPLLQVLDLRNNTLSGNVPLALKRLNEGFQYANNTGLCGPTFTSLQTCTASNQNSNKPEPFGTGTSRLPSKDIPESANIQKSPTQPNKSQSAAMAVIIGLIIAFTLSVLLTFTWYRRRKQKIASAFDSNDSRLSTDQAREMINRRRSSSPLMSLDYSNGWDPLAKRDDGSTFSQEVLDSYMLNLDEVERATQHFSETNLLGKSGFSAICKGTLRDGSVVAVKCISKISCKSDENEFLKGLKLLTSLRHENLLRLRGFCCSKGRGECFLVYDFVPNGNLLQYLDVTEGKRKALDWPTRKCIIKGIAKGIEYLHGNKNGKPTLVHRNISAEKILIDQHYNPLLSDSGIHKLLADDIVFSTLKSSAAMGYLAPEYTTTGRFTEKSDIYAFGMIIFQILSGKSRITQLNCHGAEISRFEDFIDVSLGGKFKESEAARLGEVALLCTHESPDQRPDIKTVMQELDDITSDS